jgi:hypothetical protein
VSVVPGSAAPVETQPLAPPGNGPIVSPRAAVDLFVNGRTAEAARAYAELAAREPNEVAYPIIAKILADRARGACPGGGEACER